MSDDTNEEFGYPQLTQTIKLGDGLVTVRAASIEEMDEQIKKVVEKSGDWAAAAKLVKAAFGITAASTDAKPASTGQGKTYSRTSKPGSKPAASGDVPFCACGIPMNDVRGKFYTKGPKQGQPYPNSFYPSRDCQGGCDAQ